MRGNGLRCGDTWIKQHYVQRQREVKKPKVAYFKPIINDLNPRNDCVKRHCKLEKNKLYQIIFNEIF